MCLNLPISFITHIIIVRKYLHKITYYFYLKLYKPNFWGMYNRIISHLTVVWKNSMHYLVIFFTIFASYHSLNNKINIIASIIMVKCCLHLTMIDCQNHYKQSFNFFFYWTFILRKYFLTSEKYCCITDILLLKINKDALNLNAYIKTFFIKLNFYKQKFIYFVLTRIYYKFIRV